MIHKDQLDRTCNLLGNYFGHVHLLGFTNIQLKHNSNSHSQEITKNSLQTFWVILGDFSCSLCCRHAEKIPIIPNPKRLTGTSSAWQKCLLIHVYLHKLRTTLQIHKEQDHMTVKTKSWQRSSELGVTCECSGAILTQRAQKISRCSRTC